MEKDTARQWLDVASGQLVDSQTKCCHADLLYGA